MLETPILVGLILLAIVLVLWWVYRGLRAFRFRRWTGRRSAAKLLTKDEARRIAANIAKLSELLQGA